MADIFIGANRGVIFTGPDAQTSGGVIEGSSTGSTDIEIRIDTGKGTTRQDANLIIARLLEYLNDGRTAVFPF